MYTKFRDIFLEEIRTFFFFETLEQSISAPIGPTKPILKLDISLYFIQPVYQIWFQSNRNCDLGPDNTHTYIHTYRKSFIYFVIETRS